MKPTLTVPLEIKSLNSREFEGHGSMFGNVDHGGDVVLKGAFKRSLADHKSRNELPQMFWMHDPALVPGKWTEMYEDDKGLVVKGVLANTQLGNETHELLKMKAVRGLSIGYVTTDQDYDSDGNRLIKEVDLWEVSVVSMPMNPKAQVANVKTRTSASGVWVPTIRDIEQRLRDGGFSWRDAKRFAPLIIANASETERDGIEEQPRDVAGLDVDLLREIAKSAESVSAQTWRDAFAV